MITTIVISLMVIAILVLIGNVAKLRANNTAAALAIQGLRLDVVGLGAQVAAADATIADLRQRAEALQEEQGRITQLLDVRGRRRN